MRTRSLTVAVAVLVALVATVRLCAQAPTAKTASQFYMEYRAAFDKAKAIEDLFPYMSAASISQAKATPADQRTMLFGMMKELGALTSVTILREATTSTGAALLVEGVGHDRTRMKGTIEIVREAGTMKIGKEQWSN